MNKSNETKVIIKDSKHVGKTYDRLTVLTEYSGLDKAGIRRRYFKCKCECGSLSTPRKDAVLSEDTVSCGCANQKHGMSRTLFYKTWSNLFERCYNKNAASYKRYGGRGITVCDRWHDFINFKEDMYDAYVKHCEEHGENRTSIDRINVNGNYEPSNCRWTTPNQQTRNQRINTRNKTGYKGILYDKAAGKYRPYVYVDEKVMYLGSYAELDKAVKVRRAAEAFYYGTIQANGMTYDLVLLIRNFYAKDADGDA